ncbi:MAG: polysaccharide biosynthesis/export family protein [Planctomycetaceae bacterium]|nr:polysaccharide biosynthesis/export family protein [Planctomycetaceae bacterium]
MTRNPLQLTVMRLAGLLLLAGSGCSSTSLFGHIPAIPVERIPPSMLGRPREDMQEISLSRLRQNPPEVYQLGPNDILGIYIETILPAGEEPPPVHFPEQGEQAPSIGFPVPIREDGTIGLPLVPPIQVEGYTLEETTELIRKAYTIDKLLLPEGRDSIIVTLIRRRTFRVLVVREEEGATSTRRGSTQEVIKRGAGFVLDLPAGENDLLHALNETGGLPGLDAKNEVLIVRGVGVDGREWDKIVAQIRSNKEPCSCPSPIPDPPNVTRIPLRFYSERVPDFTEKDIILYDGDIVMIESREREKFYTGGVLSGGEFPLPRDYDLDIMGAIAIAGGPVGSSGAVLSQSMARGGGRSVGGGGGSSGPLPPTDVIVVRKLCDGSQVPIRIDLKRVFDDPRQRILIQPEDVVILRYKCAEEIANTALSLIQFNFLFNGFRGGGFN